MPLPRPRPRQRRLLRAKGRRRGALVVAERPLVPAARAGRLRAGGARRGMLAGWRRRGAALKLSHR